MKRDSNKSRNYGRNFGLINPWIKDILWVVGNSQKPVSSGTIAKAIRIHMDKKMSSEYKWIKKLCPPAENVSLLPITTPEDSPSTKRYLDVSLEENTQLSEIDEIINDSRSKDRRRSRRNWRYSLSFRGLLLYIYNEYNAEGKSDKRRIRSVIQNPLVIKEAPFLRYSEYFEKHGFDVIGLLKKISEELFNQLHVTAEEDNYLLRRATERYSVEVENYFYSRFELASSYPYIQKMGSEEYKEIFEKISDYRQIIVMLRESWIVQQQKEISFLKRKSNYNKLANELPDTIAATANSNAIISIDELAEKYSMSNIEVLHMLSSMKPNAHIIAGLHLIPRSKIPTLHDNTRFEDARSLLKNNGIPDSCHFRLISELGFNITGKRRWNDYSDANIVKRKEKRIQRTNFDKRGNS
jgi:hypothetical protein